VTYDLPFIHFHCLLFVSYLNTNCCRVNSHSRVHPVTKTVIAGDATVISVVSRVPPSTSTPTDYILDRSITFIPSLLSLSALHMYS
jgi:hypothetical protein